jgi:serine/threonine protein kinase
MLPEEWARAKPVLLRALELPGWERIRFIRSQFPAEPLLWDSLVAILENYRTVAVGRDAAWNAATRTAQSFESGIAPAVEDLPSLLNPGETYGPYLVVRELGHGGMGQVFLAKDMRLERQVAVKSLAGKWLDSPTARRRLMREARSAAALTHANIAALYDVFEDGHHLLLVMEYVEGKPLSSVLADGPLPLGHALRLVLQIADAIGYAHDRGIVHCDLKPANVHLTPEGTAKVLDFGLARAVSEPRDDVSISEQGKVVGTPGYMAPERLLHGTISPTGDVYSLGILLFELVSGRHPYEDRGPAQVLAILSGAAPPLSSVTPDVPRELDAIVDRALARETSRRYQSAHELSRDLRPLIERVAPPSPPVLFRPRRVAAVVVSALVILTLAGFATSTFYNSPLARTDGFEQESALAWPLWGVRSLVAPVAYFVLFAVAAVTARAIVQMALAIAPLRRVCDPLLTRWRVLRSSLRAAGARTVGPSLLLLQLAAAALLFWWFKDIFDGLDSFVTQRTPRQLEVFRPDNVGHRNVFSFLLFAYVAAFGAGWHRLARSMSAYPDRGGRGLIAAGITVAAIPLFFGQVLPYRTFIKSRAERVTYQTSVCYLVGQRGTEGVLFCPLDPPPWKHIVQLDDPALRRGGSYESIFAVFDKGH